MAKVTRVAVDEIYPIVSQAVQKNFQAYKNNISLFLRKRSNDLNDIVPIRRIPFGAEDNRLFFDAIDVTKRDITEALSHTYYWNMNFNPRAAKDEFTMCMMMIIRHFIITNQMKEAEISSVYLAFSGKFYPSIHSQIFKYPPEKHRHIMEYVLNNVLTQKYDLKKYGSVLGAIRSICQTWLNTYKDKFKDPDDEDIKDIIQQLHGRIKSFLFNIAQAFYKAYEERAYMTYSSDNSDPDGFRMSDNDSLLAERCVENAMNWITARGVDYTLCKNASDKNVHVDEVKSIIESIQSDNDNLLLIRELLQLIVTEYFMNSKKKDVSSYEFISKSIVAKPNSKNKNVNRQKEIIENWLNENSPQYRKRKSRAATKSSYNKSIMIYYVLVINQANK